MENKELTERIKEYRTMRSHLTQKDVAEALNISVAAYRKIENNGEFSFEQMRSLSEILDVPFEHILCGEKNNPIIPLVERNKPQEPSRFCDPFTNRYDSGTPVPQYILNDIKIILSKISPYGQTELYQYALYIYYRETKRSFT